MTIHTRRRAVDRSSRALVFAALGDPTRLMLLARLSADSPLSISRLAARSALTRQAITKHLKVMEGARIVRSVRRGREMLFELRPKPLDEARRTLDEISRRWDEALGRLKAFVEK